MSYSLMEKNYIEPFTVTTSNLNFQGVPYIAFRIGSKCFMYFMADYESADYGYIYIPEGFEISSYNNYLGCSNEISQSTSAQQIIASRIDSNTIRLSKANNSGYRFTMAIVWTVAS